LSSLQYYIFRLHRGFCNVTTDSKLLDTKTLIGTLQNSRIEMQTGNGCWIHSLHNVLGLPIAPGNTIVARVLVPLRGCVLVDANPDDFEQIGISITDIDLAAEDLTTYQNYHVQVNKKSPTSLGNMMGLIVNESLGMRDFLSNGMPDDFMLSMLNALNDPVDKNDGIYKGKRIFPQDGLEKQKVVVEKKDLNTCSAIITVMQYGQGNDNVNAAIIYYGEKREQGQFGHYVSLWQDCTNQWHFYDSLLPMVYSASTPQDLTSILRTNGIRNMLNSTEKFIHAFALPKDAIQRKAACLKAYNNLQNIVSSSLLFYGLPLLRTIQQDQVLLMNSNFTAAPAVTGQPNEGNNYNTRSRTKRRTID
jgi:hypothetical protein